MCKACTHIYCPLWVLHMQGTFGDMLGGLTALYIRQNKMVL